MSRWGDTCIVHPVSHLQKRGVSVPFAECFTFHVSNSVPLRLLFSFFPFGPALHRDLSNNQISELASDAFQGLRSLNSLWVPCDYVFISDAVYTKHHKLALWTSRRSDPKSVQST